MGPESRESPESCLCAPLPDRPRAPPVGGQPSWLPSGPVTTSLPLRRCLRYPPPMQHALKDLEQDPNLIMRAMWVLARLVRIEDRVRFGEPSGFLHSLVPCVFVAGNESSRYGGRPINNSSPTEVRRKQFPPSAMLALSFPPSAHPELVEACPEALEGPVLRLSKGANGGDGAPGTAAAQVGCARWDGVGESLGTAQPHSHPCRLPLLSDRVVRRFSLEKPLQCILKECPLTRNHPEKGGTPVIRRTGIIIALAAVAMLALAGCSGGDDNASTAKACRAVDGSVGARRTGSPQDHRNRRCAAARSGNHAAHGER